MVGVAGKSKGCTTCRRRKVKCDEGRPLCQRCQRSKLECEGYDRYPVFIHRTQTGFKKRAPLEEAKPFEPSALQRVASPELEASQFIAWFWQSFARSPPSKYALQSPSHWLVHTMEFQSPLPALQKAMLAVAVTRYSKVGDRPEMLKEGRQLYTDSLNLTRKALLSPDLVLRDDILATTCIMVLYELFDSTSQNLDGWFDHLSGLSRLLQHRGPRRHRNTVSRAIFEHSRYLIMMQHLMARRACVFSQRAWLEDPWSGITKSVEQQTFDYGLKLSAIFERCDVALQEGAPIANLVELFADCTDLYDGIQCLRDQHITGAVAVDLEQEPGSEPDTLTLENPAGLLLNITAMGVQLGACTSACDVFNQMSEMSPSGLDVGESNFEDSWNQVAKAVSLFGDRVVLARRIIRSIMICIIERTGSMGAARMIFALRLAMQQLPSSDPEFEEATALMERLSGQTSRFGTLIGQVTTATSLAILKRKAELVQENAASLAAHWQRLAETDVGLKTSAAPVYRSICNIPHKTFENWVRSTYESTLLANAG